MVVERRIGESKCTSAQLGGHFDHAGNVVDLEPSELTLDGRAINPEATGVVVLP